MKRIKLMLFGTRATGENIINQIPSTRTVTAGNIAWSFGDWRDELNVSKKANELRIILQGSNKLTTTNIKLDW